MSIETIKKGIEQGKVFALSSHLNPDADGVGACVAFKWLLDQFGKKAIIVNKEKLPVNFDFIEKVYENFDSFEKLTIKPDTWVVLDSSMKKRTGFDSLKPFEISIINIDHHRDNEKFGRYNWIDSQAPATCEMIFTLIESYGLKIPKHIAEVLYSGLLIDTGGFKFSNTNQRVFKVAYELSKTKIDCYDLYKRNLLNKSIKRIKLEGILFNNVELLNDNKICVMMLTKSIIDSVKADRNDLEGISNLTMLVKGVQIGLMFIENNSNIKVCLRSNGNTDIGKVASFFGGGGHAAAAGCVIKGTLSEVKRQIIEKIEYLEDNNKKSEVLLKDAV